MKKSLLGLMFVFAFATFGFAQNGAENKNVILKAGTELTAQLQSVVDAEKSKSNDDFILRLTEDLAGNGEKFVKGTELSGRVVRVKTVSPDNNVSEVSLFFDFLKDGDNYLPVKAFIVSADKFTDLQFTESPVFKNATIISMKGKNLRFDEGTVFHIKLSEDVKSAEN